MDFSIAAILIQDGLTNGAIYALLALALVLVFSVTRVILIPQGEFVAFGALTLAALQAHQLPRTVFLLLALSAAAAIIEARAAWVQPSAARGRLLLGVAGRRLMLPLMIAGLAYWSATGSDYEWLRWLTTIAVIVPLGGLLYRLAFQPLSQASNLVLLIAAVAVHLALSGLGLLMFGADGARTTPLSDAHFDLGELSIGAQSLLVIVVALLLIAILYLYFGRTLAGKALRATSINRMGARLVGISPEAAGNLAFTLAALIGAVCGLLVSPLTTLYYDSGFLIGLKGFVGAIVGGLVSYPLAAAGAILVGLLESFSSFWASAYKEVIVFTLIIPVLLWRSLRQPHADEEQE